MKIPALTEVTVTDAVVGRTIWGWWDGVCRVWHVLPNGKSIHLVEPIEKSTAIEIYAGKSRYVFDDTSRLLVEGIIR